MMANADINSLIKLWSGYFLHPTVRLSTIFMYEYLHVTTER